MVSGTATSLSGGRYLPIIAAAPMTVALGTLGAAIFTYDGITPGAFPDGLPVEMDIGVFRTIKGDIERTIRGSLQLVRPITATSTSVIPGSLISGWANEASVSPPKSAACRKWARPAAARTWRSPPIWSRR